MPMTSSNIAEKNTKLQIAKKGHCQHYCVVFEFLHLCDIHRHHDCDLHDPVKGTTKIFSVKNTPQPLTLKVCEIPCLCDPCITDQGNCENSQHADPWRSVNLVPLKGDNITKHGKCKAPVVATVHETDNVTDSPNEDHNNESGDARHHRVMSSEPLPTMDFEQQQLKKLKEEQILKRQKNIKSAETENIR